MPSHRPTLTRAEVHRRALLAAAAVAFGASGCGETAVLSASPADGLAADGAAEVSGDAAPADSAAAADSAATTDSAALDAGAALADASAGTDASAGADASAAGDTAALDASGKPDCTQAGVDWAACCQALAAWCAAAHGDSSEAAQHCQFGPQFDGSTGCTPWGPPAPPAWRAPEALA